MCCCCCCSLHRHQIHLISYGCVAFGLITTGLVFTVFSIFQKDSQIGKVWLAGPTTMVVGLVLCGKVLIDWGPAMMHAREGSIDSRLMEQAKYVGAQHVLHPSRPENMANPVLNRMEYGGNQAGSRYVNYGASPEAYQRALSTAAIPTHHHSNGDANGPRPSSAQAAVAGRAPGDNCIIYAQYEPPLSNLNCTPATTRHASSSKVDQSPRASTVPSPAVSEVCECAKYGSIRRPAQLYQGESFVLNDRNYLI